ncbi:dipeptidase [Kaarinaea lacus]
MRTMVPWLLIAIAVSTLAGCAAMVDSIFNSTYLEPPYEASEQASQWHQTFTVIDLHADQLLWNRDLLKRASRGHVDLPRLLEGNVALQVFGVVNGVPFPLRMENNVDKRDLINTLASVQGWPEETHKSRLQRALYQANKLADRVQASEGKLILIKTKQDLDTLLQARQRGERTIGGMLSVEGTHALEGEVSNIELLYEAGFRMIGLAHLTDNQMAGSAHGAERHGLTDKGRELLQIIMEKNMIIDLAHASEKTIDDVLAVVDRPVIASHGGVRGTCDLARNLADRHVKGIAQTGGIIGIGIYKYASCGKTMEETVKAMRYVTDLVGIEHVAVGSDFDGFVTTVVDASGLAMLTDALLQGGFTESEIAAIMGGNAVRVFQQLLPGAN